jgi:hypothetical protein
MGLLNKFQHSKEDSTPASASNIPQIMTPPSTEDVSSSVEYPKGSPPPYTPYALTSTPPKAPPPAQRSGSNSHWPAVPHTTDYQARIAQKEEEAKAQPQRKSWIKKTFNLADPSDPEYYERRFTASGNGSDYEQANQYMAMGTGGVVFRSDGKKMPFHQEPSV